MEAHPTLEYLKIKGDKTYGGLLVVEAHPTLEYFKIKGDKTYVESPGCGGPPYSRIP